MNHDVIRRLTVTLLCALPFAVPASDLFAEPSDCIISPNAVVDVASAVPGLIEEVRVERSEEVRAGQVLARLEAGVEAASLELAKAWSSIDSEVRIEEVTGARERRHQQRINRLYASRAVALDDQDRAQTEAELGSLRLRYAREKRWIRELDALKAAAALERRVVRSPIDGVVVERYRSAGEYVENQPIARLAQLNPLRVETILPMELFGQVEAGMVGEIRPEQHPDKVLRAVVMLVDPLGDAASGTFGVRLELPNPGRAVPAGIKCEVLFLPGLRGTPASMKDTSAKALRPVDEPGTVVEPPAADSAPEPPLDGASERGLSVQAPAPPEPAAHLAAAGEETQAIAVSLPAGAPPAHTDEATQRHLVDADAAVPIAPSCSRLGPMDTAAYARELAARLSAADLRATVLGSQQAVAFGYIVVSPTARELDLELAALEQQYRAAGIQHLMAMPQGAYAGRVSLGVYKQESAAERRRVGVQGLGLVAEVLPRIRSEQRWYVQAESANGAAAPASIDLPREACGEPVRAAGGQHQATGPAS